MKLLTKLAISLISITVFFSSMLLAYEPSVGIPMPDWGGGDPIERQAPNRPDAWPNQVVDNYYYVDVSHANATDSNNPFGSPDLPRATIPEGDLQAGAYVEIHNGPYTGGGRISINSLGTELAPVWIKGDSLNKALIRGETIITGSYAYIENLFFDTSRKTLSLRCLDGACSDHIVVRNNEFSGPGLADGNTQVLSVAGNGVNNIIIYNNHIHGFGDISIDAAENDYHGIHIGHYADYTWVLNNHIHNNGGDSIQVGEAGYADPSDLRRPSHVYIGANNFHDDGENAVDIKGADNIVVSSNIMYGYGQSTSSDGEVIVIHNNPTNVWVLNNTIHDAVLGVVVTGADNAWIIGNQIYNVHALNYASWDPTSFYSVGTAIHFRSTKNSGAVNNTIYDFDNGIQLATGSGYIVRNNIIAYRTRPDGSDITGDYKVLDFSTIDNNILYHPDGERIRRSSNQVVGLKEYQDSYGACALCSNTNPLFIAYQNLDFKLQNNSPAIDKGATTFVFEKIATLYEVDAKKDLSGEARFQGDKIDIGAFEFGSGQQYFSVPFAPSNIQMDYE
ncbi:hypothetical protein CXF72_18670 [Psychromonas sp. MB-3u-54]|uniref:choice-of-anchor Q domain-containing protein n=1 Tax=Psychromonas sp. MB-3u-54 TaxID=2058319 RepID=UPI000C335493|nr:choice-of-anchor Q domain-containing protein [Psychromonas sp. MB-3u-54]PKH01062.1 hypothetical protein CXF72_18670 [Psychromonas sp. MB-3u-54]